MQPPSHHCTNIGIRAWAWSPGLQSKPLIDLLLHNFDDFGLTTEADENPDLAFGNAEILC